MLSPSEMCQALIDECNGNQSEAARRAGTSHANIFRVWKGEQEPGWKLFSKIKTAYEAIEAQENNAA